MAATITAGEVSDYSRFDLLMEEEGPEPRVLVADRGYDSDHIRETMAAQRAATVIPTRKNRSLYIAGNDYIYALRNRIERCFNKLKTHAASPHDTTKPRKATSASRSSPPSARGCTHSSTRPRNG